MTARRQKIVDLTLPIENGMAGIPTIALYDRYPVAVQAVTLVDPDQRAFLEKQGVRVVADAEVRGSMNTVFTLNSHVGTHIDAPRHFVREGTSVDEIPLDGLVMREAVVLDVSHKGPGEAVTAADLVATGVRPTRDQVPVIKTLWTDRAWGTPDFWPQMVYLDPSVGGWIADHGVTAVAFDCFPEKAWWRVQMTPAERGINHKTWLGRGITMIQFVTNVGALGRRFTLVALPLRLRGMDGSPARVVGIEPAS